MLKGILAILTIGILTILSLGMRKRVIERQKRERKAYLRRRLQLSVHEK